MATRRTFMGSAAAGAVGVLLGEGGAGQAGPLRYLQIGTKHAHADKLSVYAASADWEVVGVVEEDAARRRALQGHPLFGKFPLLTLEEGLAIPGVQVAGIESEIKDLLHYARLALNAGLHIHLDKPAGVDLKDYAALLASAEEKRRVVQMGYMFRYNPAVQMLHRFLKAGWLGEIFESHAVISKVVPPADRKEMAAYPGGIMFELGCHAIDLTERALGCPETVTAYPRRTHRGEADGLMDNMLAVFSYPHATATVRSSAVEVGGFGRRHLTVCGTEGTFHIQPLDEPRATITLSRERGPDAEGRSFPKGTSLIDFQPPYARYVADAADLASIVRGEKDSDYPPSFDLCVQKTVLQASGVSA